MSITKITYTLISLVLAFIVLQKLEALIIPFIFSVIIWLIIRKVRGWILEFATKMPYWLATVFSTGFILLLISFSMRLIGSQVQKFYAADTIETYSQRAASIWNSLQVYLGEDIINEVRTRVTELDFTSQAQELVGALSGVLGSFFMVLLYLLFIIFEEKLFKLKLKAIYPDEDKRKGITSLIQEIIKAVESYISLKTIVSIITAGACYIALLIIGVDFALFWAILIFLLNYIPTIGSLIATLFPALIALVQFEQFQMFAIVLVVLGGIQLVVGNILEPKIMGDNLNISPLVVILSLTLWNMIWGVVGMILSVPIMVIIIIVMSKIPATKKTALMLSGTGKIGN